MHCLHVQHSPVDRLNSRPPMVQRELLGAEQGRPRSSPRYPPRHQTAQTAKVPVGLSLALANESPATSRTMGGCTLYLTRRYGDGR
jgi:hypothetical protein